jgi:hypothetical protein
MLANSLILVSIAVAPSCLSSEDAEPDDAHAIEAEDSFGVDFVGDEIIDLQGNNEDEGASADDFDEGSAGEESDSATAGEKRDAEPPLGTAISSEALLQERASSGPTVFATFALYGNLPNTKQNREHPELRHVRLPKILNDNTTWIPINTLGNDTLGGHGFSVRKYTSGGGTWWNKPDKDYWVYEDTSLKHNHKNDNRQIHVANNNSKFHDGFVYMAYAHQNFVKLNSFDDLPPANYFYEVYSKGAYTNWRQNWARFPARHGIFDITRLSRNNDCPNFSGHPKWKVTRARMKQSAIARHKNHHITAIYIGLYSACFIDSDDAKILRNALDEIQDALLH